jgi:hypothetical protein
MAIDATSAAQSGQGASMRLRTYDAAMNPAPGRMNNECRATNRYTG